MKLFTIFAIIAFSFTSAFGQSIEFVDYDETKYGEPDESSVSSYASFKNISNFDVGVKIFITVLETTEGFDLSFCDYWNCYFLFPGDETFETEKAEIVSPGAVGGDLFHMDIFPNGTVGTAKIKIKFFNESDPEDFIEYTANFNIGVNGVWDDYYSGLLGFDNPVPNPAVDYTKIGYRMPAGNNSYLEVFDASGRLVMSKQIEPGTSVIPLNVSELTNGSYIYSMKVNGTMLPSKKLVISR